MIIVTGHLRVAPGTREAYLLTCVDVVRRGRAAPGCRDFSLSADLVDADRVDVLEVWEDEASLAAFRGDGIPGRAAGPAARRRRRRVRRHPALR